MAISHNGKLLSSRQRKRHLPVISLEKVPPAVLTKNPSFQDQLEDEETIRQALSCLSEKLRTVIVLRYHLDLSYVEIAEILKVPVGTVKSRLDLALKTLRKELRPSMYTLPLKEVQNEL